MKKFQVNFYYEEAGSTIVEAKTADEAEKKVYKELEENGMENIKDFDCDNREYDTVESEEII